MSSDDDTERFNELMTRLDHTMAVVTTASGGVHAGCLIGFHSQSGIEPPTYAIWISKANQTYRIATMAETFGVHFLGKDDWQLAKLFGTTTGDDIDKFERCSWVPGPDGVPVLDEVEDRFVGRRTAFLDAGSDHVCIVLDPVEASVGTGEMLWFGEVADLEAGHAAEERQRPD
jgi:flavin reductase (DIM6/NTAB) family NADH-FMN oxidoreductase RutF